MRQLYWKEWQALRWFPLATMAAIIVLNGAWTLAVKQRSLDGFDAFHSSTILGVSWTILIIVWMLSGALAGVISTNSEVKDGTLKFLFSLPIRRETIWGVKALTALYTVAASILLSGLALLVMECVIYGSDLLLLAGRNSYALVVRSLILTMYSLAWGFFIGFGSFLQSGDGRLIGRKHSVLAAGAYIAMLVPTTLLLGGIGVWAMGAISTLAMKQ